MRGKLKWGKVNIPIVNRTLYVCFDNLTATQLCGKHLMDGMDCEADCNAGAVYTRHGCKPLVMYINPDQDDLQRVITIAHESHHVATAVWYAVGANLKPVTNDEVHTYTQDYVMESVMNIMATRENMSDGY